MATTCRCSCTAYGGACDCRFDGVTQGKQQGYAEALGDVVEWLLALDPHDVHDLADLAAAIKNGTWRGK